MIFRRQEGRDDWAERLGPMMRIVGVRYDGPTGLPAPALAEEMRVAAKTCARCPETTACRTWLDGVSAGTVPRGGWRDFCPNAARFEALTR
jgi:hypothetical protein